MDDVTAREEAIRRRLLARFVPEDEADRLAKAKTKRTAREARLQQQRNLGA